MLKKLIVRNFAIIEDIELEFKKNMTTLTGATGAGKSLIIDSIGLLLGDRADLDMIRYGQTEALIIGHFVEIGNSLITLLEGYGIKKLDEIIIERNLNLNGKSTIKVNGTIISLHQLKQIGYLLGDIHVQHDTYRLINRDNYLSFLDDFTDKKFLKIYNDYQIKRSNYLNAINKYNECLKKNNLAKDKLEYLKFQKAELEALELEEDLDIKLASEIEKLSNFDKIYKNLNEAYQNINDNLNLDSLYDACDNLKQISKFDDLYLEKHEILNDAYYQIEEVKSYLYKAKSELDFDPSYLDSLNERLFEINKVKDKYKLSLNELVLHLEKIKLELNLITNFDETIKELEKNVLSTFEKVKEASMTLRDNRMKEAQKFEKYISSACLEIDLKNTKFIVEFNDNLNFDPFNSNLFGDDGIDEVDFLVSFNLGEPVKPLSKVASGGELSRMMLLFKALYLEKHELSFMVFDEIDSGLSGVTARKVAVKMHEMAKKVQVLAITHLANVAAISDTQLFISKDEINGRTSTSIKELSYDERIEVIAMMLSGLELSQVFLETAKEMIDAYR